MIACDTSLLLLTNLLKASLFRFNERRMFIYLFICHLAASSIPSIAWRYIADRTSRTNLLKIKRYTLENELLQIQSDLLKFTKGRIIEFRDYSMYDVQEFHQFLNFHFNQSPLRISKQCLDTFSAQTEILIANIDRHKIMFATQDGVSRNIMLRPILINILKRMRAYFSRYTKIRYILFKPQPMAINEDRLNRPKLTHYLISQQRQRCVLRQFYGISSVADSSGHCFMNVAYHLMKLMNGRYFISNEFIQLILDIMRMRPYTKYKDKLIVFAMHLFLSMLADGGSLNNLKDVAYSIYGALITGLEARSLLPFRDRYVTTLQGYINGAGSVTDVLDNVNLLIAQMKMMAGCDWMDCPLNSWKMDVKYYTVPPFIGHLKYFEESEHQIISLHVEKFGIRAEGGKKIELISDGLLERFHLRVVGMSFWLSFETESGTEMCHLFILVKTESGWMILDNDRPQQIQIEPDATAWDAVQLVIDAVHSDTKGFEYLHSTADSFRLMELSTITYEKVAEANKQTDPVLLSHKLRM